MFKLMRYDMPMLQTVFRKPPIFENFFYVDVNHELAKGKYRVTDSVTIMLTSGHSIGHQSVIIQYGADKLVYCGDAAPLRENLEKRNILSVLYRADQALKSIDKLRAVKDAVYIFSYDKEQQILK